MKIEIIRQVRSPANLKSEVGDEMEVSARDGKTLINGGYAKIVTELKGKGKDGKISK